MEKSGANVALMDNTYLTFLKGISLKNMLSRIGLTRSVEWPDLRNVASDKIRTTYPHKSLLFKPQYQPTDLCFLQFTSGSTSDPKGVMVANGCLMAQLRQLSSTCNEIFGNNNCSVVSTN